MFYFSLNSKSIVLAKTLATAGLLATVVQILPAQAATLDWGSLKNNNQNNNPFAGTISASNTISVSGGGTVDLELGTIANINGAVSRIAGITGDFARNPTNNSPTPRIDPLLNGTLPDASPSLYLQQDSGAVANELYAGFKFNNPGGVSGLTFTLFDIDKSSNSLASGSWQDRVIVRGLFNGGAVLPTTVSAVSTFLNASTGNISVNGAAGYAGAIIDGATVLDGTKSVDNNLSNDGNVTISFAGPVDQLYIDFTQAPGATGGNPGSHGIGIGNMTYQAVPEPLTILGAATAIAFGTAFKRRSAKSNNRD